MKITISGILTDFKGRIFLQQDSPTSLAVLHHRLAVGTTPVDVLDQAFRQETGLIIMPVRMTGVFYDGSVPGGELIFCFRCTMRGGELAVPDGGLPAGFFDCPPLPEGLSSKFRQQVENGLHHPGGPPTLETVASSVGRRLAGLFGRGKPADDSEPWRVAVRLTDQPVGNGVEFALDNEDEMHPATPVAGGEPPWAAARRLAGAGHQAVELRRVEIGADRPILILDFAPVGQ